MRKAFRGAAEPLCGRCVLRSSGSLARDSAGDRMTVRSGRSAGAPGVSAAVDRAHSCGIPARCVTAQRWCRKPGLGALGSEAVAEHPWTIDLEEEVMLLDRESSTTQAGAAATPWRRIAAPGGWIHAIGMRRTGGRTPTLRPQYEHRNAARGPRDPRPWRPRRRNAVSAPETPSNSDPRAQATLRLLTGEFALRTERPGTALRGLAAELVDERRLVAELRHEVTQLKARLESPATHPRRRTRPALAGARPRLTRGLRHGRHSRRGRASVRAHHAEGPPWDAAGADEPLAGAIPSAPG